MADDGRVLGETLFASTRNACDTLDPTLRARLEGRRAIHRYGDRYEKMKSKGGTRADLDEDQKKQVPPVSHPVIRTHPVTGRKSVFVNEGFTVAIEGMPEEESRTTLAALHRHAVRADNLYTHRWPLRLQWHRSPM